MRTVQEAAQWLLDRDNFLILTHRRPDGDAIGSAVALCLGLRSLGKTSHIWENPQFTPRHAGRLAGLTTGETTGTIVAVDLATEGLFPLGSEVFV